MALVYVALFLSVLMIAVAFAVDLGNLRQQKTNGQAAADAAALSGAQLLSSSTANSWYYNAATTAFNSLGLNAPAVTSGTSYASDCGSGCRDYSYTSGSTTYFTKVTTPWQGDATTLGVQVCWNVPTSFATIFGYSVFPTCAGAAAQQGASSPGTTGGGCGVNSELFNTNKVVPNASGGINGGTLLQTTYDTYDSPPNGNGTQVPLDTSKVYLVVQDQYGNFSTPAATLTDQSPAGSPMTKVLISYTVPMTMATFTATLSVTDLNGKNCGETGWTTCTNQESFFESHDTDGDSSIDVFSDGDEDITPLGTVVDLGTGLVTAKFADETPINPLTTVLYIDGTQIPNGYPNTTTAITNPPTDQYAMTTWPPSGWGLVSSANSQEYGQLSGTSTANISVVLTDNVRGSGPPKSVPTGYPSFHGNPGMPIAGYPVTITPLIWSPTAPNLTGTPAAGITAQTGTTGLDGTAYFSFTDTVKESVYFVVSYGSGANNIYGTGTVDQQAGIGFNAATVPTGLTPETDAPAWPNPGGFNETMAWSPANLTNGWHSVFFYTKDGDQNKAGGDCGFVDWMFTGKGGTGSGGSLRLVS
jgi:Flp pilus assembly protein TadG